MINRILPKEEENLKETNEKKSRKSKSLLSKITSNDQKKIDEKKTKKTIKETKPKDVIQPENFSDDKNKDLEAILKINENAKPIEYYDLPYRYNQTVIKILAQTPHSIYIYWDISDDDRNKMIEKYGENLFYDTKPVLLVHNQTQNYSFEVEIDDFTNSWYLRTPTSNCVFNIELGRKKISNDNNIQFDSSDNILHISSSNNIESPNDHVLNESFNSPIYFKNIKTNELEERKISNLSSIKNLYKEFDFNDEFIHNPSSDFKI